MPREDDLDGQFDLIVEGLRRDVRRLRQQVEKFQRAYQKRAEAQSRASGSPDETSQRAFRRMKQLQLAISHIESSAAYLGGTGMEPQREDDWRRTEREHWREFVERAVAL